MGAMRPECTLTALASTAYRNVLRELHSCWVHRAKRRLASIGLLAVIGCSAFEECSDCDRFDEQVSAESTVVRVRNDSALTLYFRSAVNFGEPFTLKQDGTVLPWAKPSCFSCASVVRGDGCALIALFPSVIALPSGVHHDFVWPGTLREKQQITRGCAADPSNEGTCEQSVRAQHGSYSIAVEAFADYACATGPRDECGCTQTFSSGACEISQGSPAAPHETREVELDFPTETTVEISFD
jgi:hypothetical protein